MPGSNYVNTGCISSDFLSKPFNVACGSATGTTTLVAGSAGQRIFVYRALLTVDGTGPTPFTFADGTAALSGSIYMTNVGINDMPFDGNPYFQTSIGNNLNLLISGITGHVTGTLYYTQG